MKNVQSRDRSGLVVARECRVMGVTTEWEWSLSSLLPFPPPSPLPPLPLVVHAYMFKCVWVYEDTLMHLYAEVAD